MINIIGLPSSGKTIITELYTYTNYISSIDIDQYFNKYYNYNTEHLLINYGLERLFRLIERSNYLLINNNYLLRCLGGSSYLYNTIFNILTKSSNKIILIIKLFNHRRAPRNIFNLIKLIYLKIERTIYYNFLYDHLIINE